MAPPEPSLMELQPKENRHACVLKAVQLIDSVCKFSLNKETLRGESVEQI